MTDKIFIGIDPGGHSKASRWAFCIGKDNIQDPMKVVIMSGQERTNVVGCPALAKELELRIMYPRQMLSYPIYIEQPLGNYINTIASGWCDIGHIAGYFKHDTIVVIRADAWKCYLRDSGLVPAMKGDYGMKPKKVKATKKTPAYIRPSYKQILDAHFGLDMTEDQWASWAICYYNASNYRE